ncbi:uncharacterized protein [Palaemon carinicauda]|uniref:uncharacterized protein n=1 Tax=Palaemon carinicauda TaxID=392227 RepID=UPI0035B61E42
MRFYRPPKRSSEDTWSEKQQIVLPLSVRNSVMEIAHDSYGGHLGIHKTYCKILNCFFWPNMKKDVAESVRTCHVCQISGNPNQVIPKAPLQPILVPDESFSKIIIDNVGPLPKTKKGNKYLLTLICPMAQYPIAIPLSAKNIANSLLKVFTNFGIPKEIQSDRSSNFTSDLFAQVLKELNIKQTLSSAYRPESQGALERWHQTFKSMLRKLCVESQLEWEEGINFLLFAIREVPHESLGFSPYEMLFGRTPDRMKPTQIIHINLLKAYHSRDTGNGSNETVVNLDFKVDTPGEDNSLEDLIASSMPQTNTEVLNNLDLFLSHHSPWQSQVLKNVISSHSTLFNDFPRKSDLLLHDIELVPGTTPIHDLIDSVGQAKFVTKIDLVKGYYQVGLTEKAKLISAFITPFGLFQYEVMPFDLTNAPSTFQRLVNFIIQDLEGVYCYLNDIVVTGQTWEEHVNMLKCLFRRLEVAGLTINLKNYVFCKATVTYLGHIVGDGNVRPKTANVEAVLEYPAPTTKKSLQSFLGLASYYWRFCKNFSSVAAPLTSLTSPNVKFIWTEECQASFEALKLFLINNPVLKSPNFNKPFILQIDASDAGAGGVLLQESDESLSYNLTARRHIGDHQNVQLLPAIPLTAVPYCLMMPSPDNNSGINAMLLKLPALRQWRSVYQFQHVAHRQLVTSLCWEDRPLDKSYATLLCDVDSGTPRPLIPSPMH